MDAAEYLGKKRLLAQYQQMQKSPAYAALHAQIEAEHKGCIKGLRNRQLTIEARQEYQEGADLTERLAAFVQNQIDALTRDTTLSPEEIQALKLENIGGE